MRRIKINNWTITVDNQHVSNIIEISRDELFTDIIITETSTTLSYYDMIIEPTPIQSLWIRVTRQIEHIPTGVITSADPTTPYNVEYIATNEEPTSDYVGYPMIYLGNDTSTPLTSRYLEDVTDVNGNLIINLSSIDSDNPKAGKIHIVIENELGEVLYHKVDTNVGGTIIVDTTLLDLGKQFIVSGSYSNTSGIVGKFNTIVLYSTPKPLYTAYGMFPQVDLNGSQILFTDPVITTGSIEVVVKDNNGRIVIRTTNPLVEFTKTLFRYNRVYTMLVTIIDSGNTETQYAPIQLKTINDNTGSMFNLPNLYKLKESTNIASILGISAIPSNVIYHTDEVSRFMLDFNTNSEIVLKELREVNGDTMFVEVNLKTITNVAGNPINISNLIKFEAFDLGKDRVLVRLSDSTNDMYKVYKINIDTKYLYEIYSFNTASTSRYGNISVVSHSRLVYIDFSTGKELKVLNYNEDFTTVTTDLLDLTTHDNLLLLHSTSNEINVLVMNSLSGEGVYKVNMNTLELTLINNINIINPTITNNINTTLGFVLKSLDLVLIHNNDIRVFNGSVTSTYETFISNINHTVRLTNNTFLTKNSTGNWVVHGTSNNEFTY